MGRILLFTGRATQLLPTLELNALSGCLFDPLVRGRVPDLLGHVRPQEVKEGLASVAVVSVSVVIVVSALVLHFRLDHHRHAYGQGGRRRVTPWASHLSAKLWVRLQNVLPAFRLFQAQGGLGAGEEKLSFVFCNC